MLEKNLRLFMVLFFVVWICTGFSCSNILSEFGDKESNEALLQDAILFMNDENWDDAIASFEGMDAEYLAKRSVAIRYAGAYAGRCGVSFLDAVEELANIAGSTTLFQLFLEMMTGGTSTEADDCKEAETILRGIAPDPADRTDDENLLLVFAEFGKIGIHLALYADETEAPVGTADSDFDSCSTGALGIPDANAAEVATGFTNIRSTLQELISRGTLDIDGLDVSDFDSLCTALGALPPAGSWDFCGDYDTADITGNKMTAIRSIMKEDSAIGLGANCTGDISTCNCP